MRILLTLLLLVLLFVGLIWYVDIRPNQGEPPAGETRSGAGRPLRETVRDQLDELSLRAEDIRKELAATGRIIREKTSQAAGYVADATADARTTAAIKAKLVADPDLSALAISVDTTRGVVTLAGKVPSHEAIGKAILLAFEMEGVRQVISTLQVVPERGAEPATRR